jgi:VanZ family protein
LKKYPVQSNSSLNRFYNILNDNKIYFIYLPLVVYWIALFIGTTLPVDKIPQIFNAQDKLEHLFAYFGLGVLVSLCFYFQKRLPFLSSRAFLFSILVLVLYGAVDELHQLLVPGRYCDFYDWCSDSIGGLIGIGIVYLFLKNSPRKEIESTIS